MNIITTGKKLDKSYNFYMKHNTHAVELKVNKILHKSPSLIIKLNRRSRHPSIRKLDYVRIL